MLSVVVPLLGEGEGPRSLIETLEASPEVSEILLVQAKDDPGPETELQPSWRKTRKLEAPRGRALQMNAGARASSQSLLLFLHADSRLKDEALREAREALCSRRRGAVVFRLAYQEASPLLGLLAWFGRLLSSWSPYALGDQGLGISRKEFLRRGGFAEVPILEDWLLVRSLRKDGGIHVLQSHCIASGRRFLRAGVLRQLLRNIRILYRHGDGVDLEVLAHEYYGPKPTPSPASTDGPVPSARTAGPGAHADSTP